MAGNDYVRHRLEEWAKWIRQGASGGLGYPTRCAYTRQGARGGYGEAAIPTIESSALETNEAIESLKIRQVQLYWVLVYTYAMGYTRPRIIREMHCAESTVRANLAKAYSALDYWFIERERVRKKMHADQK